MPFGATGSTVRYVELRRSTPRDGAVAALIRSIASNSIQSPHTGAMSYDTTVARIPAAALSVEDAMMLHRMSDRGDKIVVTLKMEAKTLPDAPSRNVVAEIIGSEKPDEVVVLGGHIDSWDVGQGAMTTEAEAWTAWKRSAHKTRGLKPRARYAWSLGTRENGLRGR